MEEIGNDSGVMIWEDHYEDADWLRDLIFIMEMNIREIRKNMCDSRVSGPDGEQGS